MAATRLSEVSEVLRAVSARAEKLCATVSAEQMCRRPAPESWSAAECLAHLTISHNVYEAQWREAYAAAKQKGARGGEPYRMDFIGRLLNWSLEPGRFRMTTPGPFRPTPVDSAEKALTEFLASQNMVLTFLDEGHELPLDAMMITSLFNSKVRYTVWSSFVIIATHGRRHLWQAERASSVTR